MACKPEEKGEKREMKKRSYGTKAMALGLCAAMGLTGLAGCGSSQDEQVVIYSNADDEAVAAMKNALDANGYEGQYLFQTFGTAELGGKLLAEGTDLEADLVTMSTFYVESAQEQNDMFLDLGFEAKTLDEFPSYCAPITSQEGTIILNTQMLADNQLPAPASIKDLADPVYKDMVSVTDIASSSTAWLLIQALVSEYGEDGAKEVLSGIYDNAGPHIEESGTGPLKKLRAGEVAVGFGLRQQAVADKEEGLPIDYVDPAEGNFTLTESVAVVDKGDKTNQKAMASIRRSIERFGDDRSEALLWLGKKMAFQWNNPAFGAAQVLRNRPGKVPVPNAVKSLIYGITYYRMANAMDFLQTGILAGGVFFFLLEDKRRSREMLLPAVAFLGGFLFHIAWEAKSEYVLPYFLMLFPYSVRGVSLLFYRIDSLIHKKRAFGGKRTILTTVALAGGILLFVILYPTRLIQYTVALHDEPELCILYEETIKENVRAVEMERNIE